MKVTHKMLTLVIALSLTAVLQAPAVAGQGGADSITITVDRNVMPAHLYHVTGQSRTKAETVTLTDFVIRNYFGKPIDGFIIQTVSGRTTVPIETVKEISHTGWIRKHTEDIPGIAYVVPVHMVLTDGSEMDVLMNADFGTIEGMTDLGKFFVKDPHTVTHLVFNRGEAPPPVETKTEEKTEELPLDTDGDGVPDNLDKCPNTPPRAPVDAVGCPLDSDGDGVPDYLDQCSDTPKGATVNSVGCWIIKGINFDYNKWDIKPQFYPALDQNVDILKENPGLKIEVQGHTDDIASEAYNMALSEKRAESAKAYMVSKGIEPERISTRGFGESHPIASNETPEGRSENRRIEIKILSR